MMPRPSAMLLRELRSLGRHRAAYVARFLVGGVLLAAIAAGIAAGVTLSPGFPADFGAAFNQDSLPNAMPILGAWLFHCLALAVNLTVLIVVPLLTAPVIAGEVERNTLGLLVISRLPCRRIVLDKLWARLLYFSLLLASLAPIAITFLQLGGVTPTDLIDACLAMANNLLLALAAGLVCTCIMRSVAAAAAASYAFIILWRLASLGITIPRGPESLGQVAMLLGTGFLPELPATFILLLDALLLALVVAGLPHLVERALEERRRDPIRRLVAWLTRCFTRRGILGLRLAHDDAPIGRHPLLWRELHKRFYTSTAFTIRLFYLVAGGGILAAISLAILEMSDLLPFLDELSSVDLVLGGGGLVLLGMALFGATSSFTRDRQSGSWDVLLATPLHGHLFPRAKLAGQLKPILALALALGVMGAILPGLTERTAWLDLSLAATITGAIVLLLLALGLLWSLLARSLVRALTGTLVSLVTLEFLLCTIACLGVYFATRSDNAHLTLPDLPHMGILLLAFAPLDDAATRHWWLAANIVTAALLLLYLHIRFDRLVRRP